MGRDYRKIRAWQLADDLALRIYDVTNSFPKRELFGIIQQMRRAAVSVAANIAEGCIRKTRKEYSHFLNIAQGSLMELDYYVYFSFRLHYLDEDSYKSLSDLCDQTAKTLFGLIKAVHNESK